MAPALEPMIGRYVRMEIEGIPHRVYFEEAGQGIPLVCLHTAGADSRPLRPQTGTALLATTALLTRAPLADWPSSSRASEAIPRISFASASTRGPAGRSIRHSCSQTPHASRRPIRSADIVRTSQRPAAARV